MTVQTATSAKPRSKNPPVRIAEQSAAFHAMLPSMAGAMAIDRKAKAFIVDKFYDVAEYLNSAAYAYVDALRNQHARTHFVFDFHVGEPALIGGTFAYNYQTRQFAAWSWTEQPDKIEALTAEEARAEFQAFVNKMG